ncbi:hypothetical protein BJ508DRAFT_378420 [Ascobolus immersus RN42]|uniref:DUF590-domain-containing protein n=1 Tax=Ascobolus immersus RN42 TaxID=1160509 RepID=A0A3N4HWZ1_ASCIM|nr:hypothetical protein BJ508DRAFT_378420 [Ascobolus immersus RN42]
MLLKPAFLLSISLLSAQFVISQTEPNGAEPDPEAGTDVTAPSGADDDGGGSALAPEVPYDPTTDPYYYDWTKDTTVKKLETEESKCMERIGFYDQMPVMRDGTLGFWNDALYYGAFGYTLKPYWYDNSTRYNGTIKGLKNENAKQSLHDYLLTTTYKACKDKCDTKPDYYDWADIMETLGNWILPILGIIVAFPYESNKFFSSILMMMRWLGNPVTCFSIILWNLRVTAKCGKLADMAESKEQFETFAKEVNRKKLEPETSPRDVEAQVDRQPDGADRHLLQPSEIELNQIETNVLQRHPTTRSVEEILAANTMRNDDGSTPGPSPPPKESGEIDRVSQVRESTQHARILHRQLTEQQAKSAAVTQVTSASKTARGVSRYGHDDYTPRWTWILDKQTQLSRAINQSHEPEENQSEENESQGPEEEKKVPIDRLYPPRISQLRDSLYLLSIINQFEVDDYIDQVLWYALFTPTGTVPDEKDKIMTTFDEEELNYVGIRTALATFCRDDRKRGVVAMMAAQFWFFISFIFNVVKAFKEGLGSNKASHALGIGIFLSWLPMLAIATIVDRNSVHTEEIRRKINKFLGRVRAHRQKTQQNTGIGSFKSIKNDYYLREFAGQGRRKFHYGVADKTLELLERRINYLQNEKKTVDEDPDGTYRKLERGWSKFYESGELIEEQLFIVGSENFKKDEHTKGAGTMTQLRESFRIIRHHFRPSRKHRDLALERIDMQIAFDLEEIWQVLLAAAMVLMPLWGGFTISYHTPTVGLSCRSGNYMIFNILVLTLFALEMIGWLPIFDKNLEKGNKNKRARLSLKFFLTLFEIANFIYLVYILTSLTVGAFNTCYCRASIWGASKADRDAAYVVFAPEGKDDYFYMAALFGVKHWWIVATCLAAIPLSGGVGYAILEWCLQSHLWSGDKAKARHGLTMVRKWRRATRWIYSGFMELFVRLPYQMVMFRKLKYPLEWTSWKAVDQTDNSRPNNSRR